MDLRLLQSIVYIADEKSITKAAEKCFVTQSALNQQLSKLEDELGMSLFIRARSNWRPTQAGEAYLAAARQMLVLKKDTYNRIADYAAQSHRRLTVGLIPERGVEMFTSVYPDFHRAFPEIQLEPVECHVTAMQTMIADGQLDLGLATLTTKQRDENVYHLMAEEEVLLAVPIDNALAKRGSGDRHRAPEIALDKFSDQPFVRIYQRSTLFSLTEPLFHEAGFAPRVLFSTGSNISKYRIVEAGLACALLPSIYAIHGERVVYFRLSQRPKWQITLCSRKDGWLGEPEKLFLALCCSYWRRKMA